MDSWDRPDGKTAWLDSATIVVVILLSALPYLRGLGFYSDDWHILSLFDEARGAGWRRTFEVATTAGFAARPGHGLYAALLFNAFGWIPLGYHLVNTAVIAAAAVLLHRLLARAGLTRFNALSITLLFALLPQLSTVRVWYAAFQVPLAMVFCLAALHSMLSWFASRRAAWIGAACIAALLSLACYEIFAPVIAVAALAPLIFRVDGRRLRLNRDWRRLAPLLIIFFTVIVALAIKAAVSARTGGGADPMRYLRILYGLVRPDYDWRTDNGLNLYAALSVDFGHVMLGWWDAARALVAGRLGLVGTSGVVGIGLLSGWRLAATPHGTGKPRPMALLLLGILTFCVGYAVFLLLPAMVFSPSGLGNRVSMAAAVGVAIIVVALFDLGRRRAGHAMSVVAFGLILTVAAARIVQIGGYWAEAPRIQAAIMANARVDLADLTPGATVIVDNVCPYHGPAVVFETNWDTGVALGRALGRPVTGDMVTERMTVGGQGLQTSIYGVPADYPFGSRLIVYDPVARTVTRLVDRETALAYFTRAAASRHPCPKGYVAHGVLL